MGNKMRGMEKGGGRRLTALRIANDQGGARECDGGDGEDLFTIFV